MRYAFFMGCTVPARGRHYEISTRLVAAKLGIELLDVDDFSCCGFPIKGVAWEAFFLLAARNLCLAQERDLDVCTVCSACTAVLTEVNHELAHAASLREKVNAKLRPLGLEYKGSVSVKHFARVLLEDVGEKRLREKVSRPLTGLRFAAHYGCHYVKPSEIYGGFDSVENPETLERLLRITGGETLQYDGKMDCCGGALLAVDRNIAFAMSRRKLESIKNAGADAISLVCPFCSVMYDDNQKAIAQMKSNNELDLQIPVLYYPQVLGLAMGLSWKELGMNMNRVSVKGLVARIEEIPHR
jgi:heterodisulfide reductase subunit B